jgi:hypothetical protein
MSSGYALLEPSGAAQGVRRRRWNLQLNRLLPAELRA